MIAKWIMNQICDGSRRPVVAKRHETKVLEDGHTKAKCPVCKRTVPVRRVMGVLEFARHVRATA